MLPFLTAAFENGWGHGLVACTIAAIMACLAAYSDFFTRKKKMTRAFALLFAAVTVLAGAGQAQAQGFPIFFDDSRDIMGGGPGFFRPGMPSGSSPIPRTTVMLYRRLRARHDLHQHRRAPALSRSRQWPGDTLRHRRRPRRLPLGWNPPHFREEGMAELDAAGADAAAAARICRATCRAASTTRSARGRCIWDRRSTASTAPTSPRRSDRRFRPDASA